MHNLNKPFRRYVTRSQMIGLSFALMPLMATLGLFTTAIAKDSAPACQRKFDDQQIDAILVEKLHYRQKHRTQVNWQNCRYYAVIWPDNGAPDTQTIMDLDTDGNLPPEVVASGIHSDISLEEASLRSYTQPAYPREARERKIVGTVYAHVWIKKDGVGSTGRCNNENRSIERRVCTHGTNGTPWLEQRSEGRALEPVETRSVIK